MRKIAMALILLALACGKDKATDPGGYSGPPPPPPPPPVRYYELTALNVNVDSIYCLLDGSLFFAGGEGRGITREVEEGSHFLYVRFINDWYPDYTRFGDVQIRRDIRMRFFWPDSIAWD